MHARKQLRDVPHWAAFILINLTSFAAVAALVLFSVAVDVLLFDLS